MTTHIHKTGDLVGGRYRVVKYIDEGGMQQVFEAKDELLSRIVALKAPKNLSAAKRFKRSASLSAKINHANVAKTLDYVEENDLSYLVEEYIPGKDLSRILRESMRVIDPLMAARIFHHLAKGLAASHHATVVHRDLKPSNIIAVDGELFTEVKITDFGIAKMAEEELVAVEIGGETLTASHTAIGALPYMAPEMIKSIKDASFPADVWSLGALMFELLSGQKPFGSGYKAVPIIMEAKLPELPKHVVESPQFSPIAEAIFDLIKECVVADPSGRLTADDLVSKCEKLCYPNSRREFGNLKTWRNRNWGFITADGGGDIFFHIESIYGEKNISVGDRVSFARHKGAGADRAFPVIKIIGPSDEAAIPF